MPLVEIGVNPARSIGPAWFVGGSALGQLWLFIVAPLIGAAIAAAIYMFMQSPASFLTAAQTERALPSQQIERS